MAMNWWMEHVQKHAGLRFLDRCLRGCAQVMFINHPLTGFLFFLGLTLAAIFTQHSAIAFGACWGVIVSTAMAYWLRVDNEGLNNGLFGFNGVLVGAAVVTFLGENPYVFALLTLGAAVSTVAFMALANLLKLWEAPALTFPFVLVTWALLLAVYSFSEVPTGSLSAPDLPTHWSNSASAKAIDLTFLFESVFNGIAQVFLIQSPWVGVLFVVALAVGSRWAAALAVCGSVVAVFTAIFFGADVETIHRGLYGFSPVLTAIALGCTFYAPSSRVLLFCILATVSTVLAQAALDVVVQPFGIPTLTAPFVFATWIFLLAKGDLEPVPHAEVQLAPFAQK